jgi:hypothetical protein
VARHPRGCRAPDSSSHQNARAPVIETGGAVRFARSERAEESPRHTSVGLGYGVPGRVNFAPVGGKNTRGRRRGGLAERERRAADDSRYPRGSLGRARAGRKTPRGVHKLGRRLDPPDLQRDRIYVPHVRPGGEGFTMPSMSDTQPSMFTFLQRLKDALTPTRKGKKGGTLRLNMSGTDVDFSDPSLAEPPKPSNSEKPSKPPPPAASSGP